MLLWMFCQVCLSYYHGANYCYKNKSVHSVQIIGAKKFKKRCINRPKKWCKNSLKDKKTPQQSWNDSHFKLKKIGAKTPLYQPTTPVHGREVPRTKN
jgi:hypothetical protein